MTKTTQTAAAVLALAVENHRQGRTLHADLSSVIDALANTGMTPAEIADRFQELADERPIADLVHP